MAKEDTLQSGRASCYSCPIGRLAVPDEAGVCGGHALFDFIPKNFKRVQQF